MYEIEDIEKYRDKIDKKVYRFNLEAQEWILVNLKKGTVGGQHYHQGIARLKNPEITVFVSGKIEYTLKDLANNKIEKFIVDSPKIIKIYPNVFHELRAIEESFFLEPYDDESEKNDIIGEIVKLIKAIADDWRIISDLEKTSASKIFHPTVIEEEETRQFVNDNEVFLIDVDGKIIGIIAYQNKADQFYISEFIIGKEYQNKGCGKQALNLLLEKIGNSKSATLRTHPENTPAIITYLKAGFKIKGWKENCYGDGEPRLILIKGE